MTKISAKIIADSKSPQGHRLTTYVLTFPRFILAELNTHRVFSKNSASSRAIPFAKMVESVRENPFIPIAWQKEHKGMQGTEYITDPNLIDGAILEWNMAKNHMIYEASLLNKGDVTKQLCNRLLEPFMWHTVILTATEFENFFALRCPQYFDNIEGIYKKSRKDISSKNEYGEYPKYFDDTIGWLQCNDGMAEIHMMELAECMWDAMNESTPKELKEGEWHIPFEDEIILPPTIPIDPGLTLQEGVNMRKVKISTARCARVSYTVVGNDKDYDINKDIELHDKFFNQDPFHASPFEHCARVMYKEECDTYYNGELDDYTNTMEGFHPKFDEGLGWCRNFRGFIQYRAIINK